MKLRVKIVPDDTPDAEGCWITWRVRWEPGVRFYGICRTAPKGFHAVAFRKPYRRKK